MGYLPVVHYPKRTNKDLYNNLTHQCIAMNIDLLNECPDLETVNNEYGIVVDALFGFSFKPPVRNEFINIMNVLKSTSTPMAR